MSPAHVAASVCYAVIALVAIVFGAAYLVRSRIMPYHEEAIGRPWAELEPRLQTLLLGLLRLAGGGMLCGGVAIAILLAIPFRDGEAWSAVAMLVIGFLTLLPSLYATIFIRSRTGARTPVWVAVAGVGLLVAGSMLSLL